MKDKVESLIEELNSRIRLLCDKVSEVDPKHELSDGDWLISRIEYDGEMYIEKNVGYYGGPAVTFNASDLSDEGIDNFMDQVRRDKLAKDAQEAFFREKFEKSQKEARRKQYEELKKEFEAGT